MPVNKPRYSKEEFLQRGEAIYERDIRPKYEASHTDQYCAIDIETGAFAIDPDELTASDRLHELNPRAQVWMKRIGHRFLRRFGWHGEAMVR